MSCQKYLHVRILLIRSSNVEKNRVAKLEEKLDDLVSLLKSGQDVGNATSTTQTTATSDSTFRSPSKSDQVNEGQVFDQANAWEERLHNGKRYIKYISCFYP